MRLGFAGRGLVYLAVASFSLYAIWQGGRAQGTSPVLKHLENSADRRHHSRADRLGMLAFAVWCAVEASYDLDDRGSDAKGIAARRRNSGFGHGRRGHRRGRAAVAGRRYRRERQSRPTRRAACGRFRSRRSRIDHHVAAVMGWPAGRWIVGLVGLAIIGERHLPVRHRREGNVSPPSDREPIHAPLELGVESRRDRSATSLSALSGCCSCSRRGGPPYEAGGLDKAFAWLTGQPYGWSSPRRSASACLGTRCSALSTPPTDSCRKWPAAISRP